MQPLTDNDNVPTAEMFWSRTQNDNRSINPSINLLGKGHITLFECFIQNLVDNVLVVLKKKKKKKQRP